MIDYHKAVMVQEALDGLQIQPGGIYVDATFGGGTHAKAILSKLGAGRLVAFDQDRDAGSNAPDDERFILVPHNFKYVRNFLKYLGFPSVDGILADLGVSSHHFDTPARGFSFRYKGPLDMRMNTRAGQTAADVLNGYSQDAIRNMLKYYGEIRMAGKLAHAMANFREKRPFAETTDVVEAVQQHVPKGKEHKFLARIFQALRIEVNNEMAALRRFMQATPQALKPGARLVVITYHSLEDRLVKNFIKKGVFEGELEKDFYGKPLVPFRPVNSKVLTPNDKEVAENNRARSARMRIAERV